MKKKHKFTPGQVVPLEERALLSGFKFPFPVSTLGLRGAFVLTSRTYQNLQTTVNTAIVNFEKSVIKAFNKAGGDTTSTAFQDAVFGTTAADNPWAFNTNGLLARLDAAMGKAEFKLPWGGGMGNNPTFGAGLSAKTVFLGSLNPSSVALGDSVAGLMGTAIFTATTTQELKSNMETVRAETLAFNVTAAGSPVTVGILPEYVEAFGPTGARIFGTKNT